MGSLSIDLMHGLSLGEQLQRSAAGKGESDGSKVLQEGDSMEDLDEPGGEGSTTSGAWDREALAVEGSTRSGP